MPISDKIITLHDCPVDHAKCKLNFTDTLGLGVIIQCNCTCHDQNEKNSKNEGVAQFFPPEPTATARTSKLLAPERIKIWT
jgi:hypothetical protein